MHNVVSVCIHMCAHICVYTPLDDIFLQEGAYIYPFFVITAIRSVEPKLAYSTYCICLSDSLIDLDTPGVLLLLFPFCATRVRTTTIINASFQPSFLHNE